MDDGGGGQTNHPADERTAEAAQALGLRVGAITRPYNYIVIFQGCDQVVQVHWEMLTVGIELDNDIVTIYMSVFQAGLEGTGQTQVHRQVYETITALTANSRGIVTRTIINDNIIIS